MTEFEQLIALDVREAVNEWSTTTDRAEQDKQFIVGPSAIGFCSERLRRLLDRQEPTDPVDWNKAFIGTWVGEGLEQAWKRKHPHLITQAEFWIDLEGDQRKFRIPAHADVVDPVEIIVWDFKAKDGLMYVARQDTASQDYQFQRHLYALGAWQSGLFPEGTALEDVRVGNIYYDRSGKEPVPHVQCEPFSHEVIRQAVWWLEEVVDRFLAGEEAEKEPPRQVCEASCGFYSVCRAYDTDVEGVIRDTKHLEAIDMYVEGNEMEKQGKKLKREAQVILNGVEGHTPEFTLRWTQINGGAVNYYRDSYLRMDLKKRKK